MVGKKYGLRPLEKWKRMGRQALGCWKLGSRIQVTETNEWGF